MTGTSNGATITVRRETNSPGELDVPSDKFWGAQRPRSVEHFSSSQDLIPREMIAAYATLKKAAAYATMRASGSMTSVTDSFFRRVTRSLGPATTICFSPPCMDDGKRHAIQHECE